jgi:hypothetical protein
MTILISKTFLKSKKTPKNLKDPQNPKDPPKVQNIKERGLQSIFFNFLTHQNVTIEISLKSFQNIPNKKPQKISPPKNNLQISGPLPPQKISF